MRSQNDPALSGAAHIIQPPFEDHTHFRGYLTISPFIVPPLTGLMALFDLFLPELTLRAAICSEIWVKLEFQGQYNIFSFVVTSPDCKRHILLRIAIEVDLHNRKYAISNLKSHRYPQLQ